MRSLLAALLGLAACATARPAEAPPKPCAPVCDRRVLCLAISDDFAPEKRDAIVRAAAQWQEVLAPAVVFSCDSLAEAEIVTIEQGFISTCGDAKGVLLGCATVGGDSILLDPEMHGAEFAEAAAHELGHVLGLSHAASGLMSATISGRYRPGHDEATAFARKKGCCP